MSLGGLEASPGHLHRAEPGPSISISISSLPRVSAQHTGGMLKPASTRNVYNDLKGQVLRVRNLPHKFLSPTRTGFMVGM